MTRHYPLVLKGIGFVLLFFFLKAFLSTIALSSFHKVIVDAELEHDDAIEIFFATGLAASTFKGDYRKSTRFEQDKRAALTISLGDNVARKVRIDTGQQPGATKLFSLTFVSHYGPDIVFTPQDIYARFRPNEGVEAYVLRPDHVLVVSRTNDPFLVLHGDLMVENPFLKTVLPAIIAALLVVIAGRLSLKTLPAWTDVATKVSSTGVNFGSLDGIRGLAALLVLAQHTGVVRGSGMFAVWLFFALSGFLLSTPFVRQPERALSYPYMAHYLLRRFKRIVPMYFTMITITILFLGKFDVAFRHYLFLQANGHYWTVAQEMFFYLILPAVMIASTLFFRNRRLPALLFFAAVAAVAHAYLTISVVPLYGNNVTLRPMVGIFLIGVFCAFLFAYLTENHRKLFENRVVQQSLSLFGLGLFVVCMILADHLIGRFSAYDAVNRPGWFGIAAGTIILFTLLSEGRLLSRIMGWLPLRAVGVVSFSFYLLHPMMISCVRGTADYFFGYYPTGWVLFLLSGSVTYLLALFAYTYIERPFIISAAAQGPGSTRETPVHTATAGALRN